MNSTRLYIIFLFFLSSVAYSQTFKVDRTNPNYEEGDWVSYTMTRWIQSFAIGTEDIYFATTGGVGRYNFFTNKWNYPLTSSNGLADNNILLVAYDLDTDYIWCTTPYSISCYFSTFRKWENYYYEDIGIDAPHKIISIGIDRNHVWFETSNGKLLKGQKYGGSYFQSINRHEFDPDEAIQWFGYRNLNFNQPPKFFMSGTKFFEPDGYITDTSLRRYSLSLWKLDKWGTYWISTLGLGVGKADSRIQQLEMMTYGLFIDYVNALALDPNERTLWIGGIGEYENESGLTFWEIGRDQWSYFQSKYITELHSDQITSIAIDEPCIWFGTPNGVASYNRQRDEWRTIDVFSNLADNMVYDVAVDEKHLWVATAGGLSMIMKSTLESDSLEIYEITPKNLRLVEIYDVELMENLVWAGTEQGLYVYDMNKNIGGYQAETSGPMSEPVYAISRFKQEIWCGLAGGVEIFDTEQKVWLGLPQKRFYSDETILSIKADTEVVWAGTAQGVLKYDRERQVWVKYTMEDGLIDNRVNEIVPDGDYVWFGTPRGLTRFYWNNPHRID